MMLMASLGEKGKGVERGVGKGGKGKGRGGRVEVGRTDRTDMIIFNHPMCSIPTVPLSSQINIPFLL